MVACHLAASCGGSKKDRCVRVVVYKFRYRKARMQGLDGCKFGYAQWQLRYHSSYLTIQCLSGHILMLRSKTETRLLTYMLKCGSGCTAAVADQSTFKQARFQSTSHVLLALSPYLRSLLSLNVLRPAALLNPQKAMQRNAYPRSEMLNQDPVPKNDYSESVWLDLLVRVMKTIPRLLTAINC